MKRKQAFTLIELLVVISIIALLIAILLPALGAARKSARNAECLSRMRSVSIAVTAFEVDNKGFLPWSYGGDAGRTVRPGVIGDGFYYTDYLEDYMDVAEDKETDFYLCPESTLEPGVNEKRLSYSTFSNLLPNRQQTEKRVRVGNVSRPTEVIAFGDAAQNSGNGSSGPNFTGPYVGPYRDPRQAETFIDMPDEFNADGLPAPNNGYHFRFRHGSNQTGNAGFVDGHAESFTIGQVQQKNFATDY
ncbi:MAG: type II secretion system protein [Phycisphaeraceae bacterium]